MLVLNGNLLAAKAYNNVLALDDKLIPLTILLWNHETDFMCEITKVGF